MRVYRGARCSFGEESLKGFKIFEIKPIIKLSNLMSHLRFFLMKVKMTPIFTYKPRLDQDWINYTHR